ncbi:MAG: glycosyltransferase family 39 protein [Thiolinea sp.]
MPTAKSLPAANAEPASQSALLRLGLLISLWLFANALLQVWVSPTADLDQAEQLMLSQQLAWGYGSQPPLYTWLVYGLFKFTGPNLLVLLLLKAALLAGMVGALLACSRHLQLSRTQALLAVAGLALIPQFVWESQRDLTHSTLVTLLAALTLLQAFRLYQRPELGQYLLMGALLGLGMLSKYNYVLFALALLIAVLSLPSWRQRLLNVKTLAGLALALYLFAPHGYWALQYPELAADGLRKLEAGGQSLLQGLLTPWLKAFAFLSLFALIGLLFLWRRQVLPPQTLAAGLQRTLLLRLLLAVAVLVTLLALSTGTQSFKDRWYQPLLFYVPLLLVAYLQPGTWVKRLYLGSALFLMLLASLALAGQVLLAQPLQRISRPNHPYQPLSIALQARLHQPVDIIIADNRLLGGNLRLMFPHSRVLSPDTLAFPQALPPQARVLLTCTVPACDTPELRNGILTSGLQVSTTDLQILEAIYFYYPQQQMNLWWGWLK